MAITRSQIARQLLAGGGLSLEDAKMMAPRGEFLAYINPREAQMLKDAGGSGAMTPMGIPSFFDDTSYGEDMGAAYSSSPSGGGTGPSGGDDGYGGGDEFARPTYAQQLTNIQTQRDDDFESDLALATRTGRRGIIDYISDNPVTNYIRDNKKGILSTILGTALLGPTYPMLSLGIAGIGKLRANKLTDDIDDTGDGGGIKDKFKDTLDRFKELGDPNKYLAFNPNSLLDRTIKNTYNIYKETGIGEGKLKGLMEKDIEQNKKKGTPLSLPPEAYTLVG
tara:strand:+ start:327 stop:1163 length:837 start_codon:yes stop_codon:yes gene_type:complete